MKRGRAGRVDVAAGHADPRVLFTPPGGASKAKAKAALPGTALKSGKRRICVDLTPGVVRSLVLLLVHREARVQDAVAEALNGWARLVRAETEGAAVLVRRRDGRESELMIPLAMAEER